MNLTPLVERTIQLLVSEPDVVSVEEVDDNGVMIYNVTVAQDDAGKVIGRGGRVISNIRQFVGAAGSKARVKTVVKVVSHE